MWYKYFNKESYHVRIWRGYNLRFNTNENGMAHSFLTNYIKMRNLQLWRSEGPLRTFNMLAFIAVCSIYGYFNADRAARQAKEAKEAQDKEEKDELVDYMKVLETNRYGYATNPKTSVEDFLYFIANGKAMEDIGKLNDVPEFKKVVDDHMNGLDTWMADDDRLIIEYYNAYVKNAHH